MAKVKKSAKSISNWKKKSWYTILAPKVFGEKEVGHIVSTDAENISGKAVEANLMHLSGNIKKQHITLSLGVNKVAGNTAHTEVRRYAMNTAFLKRMARKGKSKVAESILLETQDNVKVRLKLIGVTRNVITSGVLKALRAELIKQAAYATQTMNYDDLVSAIVSNKFQKQLKTKIDPIYPSSVVEVTKLDRTEKGVPLKLTEEQIKSLTA